MLGDLADCVGVALGHDKASIGCRKNCANHLETSKFFFLNHSPKLVISSDWLTWFLDFQGNILSKDQA